MKIPMSGAVAIKCKTPNCPGSFWIGDFVCDFPKWKEAFEGRRYTCEVCKKTLYYSRDDLILIPSNPPAETATEKDDSAQQNPNENPSKE